MENKQALSYVLTHLSTTETIVLAVLLIFVLALLAGMWGNRHGIWEAERKRKEFEDFQAWQKSKGKW